MQFSNGTRLGAPAAIMGIMALTLVLLFIRSAGLYPGVLGDEYTYSTMSRLLPLSEAFIPGYLYLAIYKWTNLCGIGFMECSKFFNAVFFVAAAPFIYLTSRRFCSTSVSLLIVVLSMMGPINSYTSYFMPEALFFLAFWISVCYFFNLDAQAPAKKWVVFGLLMGCAALIKPHAMFMIPAFCLCILFFAYKSIERWFRIGLRNAAIFVCTMMATKFVIGFLVAGKSGLTLFGHFYTSTFESSASTLYRYLEIFSTTPTIIEGHLLANALMFGTALSVILFGSVKALAGKTLGADDRIAFLTLALLMNMIIIVGLFSASVAGTNAVETAFRVHMRYYNFMLPLLFIAAGSQLDRVHDTALKYWRLAAAVLVLVVLGYAALNHMQPFTPSYVDSPELRGYLLNSRWATALAALSALSVLLWYKSASTGSIVFMFVYLPLSVVTTLAFNNYEVRQRMVIDSYDKAGLFAKSYIPAGELPNLVVIGENPASTLRALVYVDNRHAERDLSYVPGVVYSAAQTPAEKKWVLAIGDVNFADGEFNVMRLNGFSLAKKITSPYPLAVDFRATSWPDSVARITGISHAESWGAWSEGPSVDIRFAEPLPAQFDLALTAKAFGPNVNQVFEVEVDGRRYPITLGEANTLHTLRVANSGNAQSLSIKIPTPTSPKTLGMSQDDRLLGIGLDRFEIRPAN